MPLDTLKMEPAPSVPLGPPQKPGDLGTLGPYRVIRAIGKGGMGMVFLGVDPKLRRKVALKVMLPKHMAKPQARERFLREARALAAVESDHIVPIYQVDEDRGTPYIALKYLQGSTLEEYLRSGQKLTVSQMLSVAREIAAGLQAAHDHKVVHRDIKPENIWLEAPDGRVKLIDFGLARQPERDPGVTADGMIAGTPAYMSPEQARGAEIDGRSDLFSLGGVIYKMFTGSVPFKADNAVATVLALTNDPHVPLIERNPKVPEGLSRLVDGLLAKDPNQRPASAKDVVRELKRIEARPRDKDEPHVVAIPVADDTSAWASLETDEPGHTAQHSARLQPPREAPVWLWVAGAVGLAAIALIAVFASGGPKPTSVASESPKKTPASAKAAVVTPKPAPVDPFTSLFNGKDLTGWGPIKDHEAKRWVGKDGVLSGDPANGEGEYLVSDVMLGPNFELRFDYRLMGDGADAGLVLFSSVDNPGLEIQLCDDAHPRGFRIFPNPKVKHGAFFERHAPYRNNAKAISEWNAMRITLKGGKLTVEENGSVVNEFDFSSLSDRKGFRDRHPGLFDGKAPLALQCKFGAIEVRHIKVKE